MPVNNRARSSRTDRPSLSGEAYRRETDDTSLVVGRGRISAQSKNVGGLPLGGRVDAEVDLYVLEGKGRTDGVVVRSGGVRGTADLSLPRPKVVGQAVGIEADYQARNARYTGTVGRCFGRIDADIDGEEGEPGVSVGCALADAQVSTGRSNPASDDDTRVSGKIALGLEMTTTASGGYDRDGDGVPEWRVRVGLGPVAFGVEQEADTPMKAAAQAVRKGLSALNPFD